MNIEKAIRSRRTLKLRVDPDNPLPVKEKEGFKKTIEELITLAGKAPFHYQSGERHREELSGAEPWRFYTLTAQSCRNLLERLKEENPVKSSEGILQMLAAADALILATWLPEESRSKRNKFQPNVKNMEHIAATGAAIQNLLLAATAKNITNYWSSGGCLRRPEVMEHLDISTEEILLGALFLFPDEFPSSTQTKIGKNKADRGPLIDWMKWIEVD